MASELEAIEANTYADEPPYFDPERRTPFETGCWDEVAVQNMLIDIHRVVMKVDELVSSVSPQDIEKVASSPLLKMFGGGGLFGR